MSATTNDKTKSETQKAKMCWNSVLMAVCISLAFTAIAAKFLGLYGS